MHRSSQPRGLRLDEVHAGTVLLQGESTQGPTSRLQPGAQRVRHRGDSVFCLKEYEGYEKRYYPAATFVCNKTSVDTAADPLAGLDDMNPFEIMGSKRYQRRHESQMFMELFRYISG